MAQSVDRPTSALVTISRSVSSSPQPGSGLMAQSLEPVSDSVSPSLCPSPVHALSLSVSKINKTLKKISKKKINKMIIKPKEETFLLDGNRLYEN